MARWTIISRFLAAKHLGSATRHLGCATRQPRFYDFNVYSRRKKRENLEYMHANPVNRGLVRNSGAWKWSSFLFYENGERGLVSIDPVD